MSNDVDNRNQTVFHEDIGLLQFLAYDLFQGRDMTCLVRIVDIECVLTQRAEQSGNEAFVVLRNGLRFQVSSRVGRDVRLAMFSDADPSSEGDEEDSE